MISSWIPVDPAVVVDTTNRVIAISFYVVSNITGGFSDENNSLQLPHVFVIHLDENNKAFKMNACWDNNDETLQTAVKKVKARVEATPNIKTEKMMNIAGPVEGIATGQ